MVLFILLKDYSIQILARSYAVRYRECCTNEALVWQFKPIKKSINWALWRKIDPPPATSPISERRKSSSKRKHQRTNVDGDTLTGEERKFNLKEKLISVGMEEVVSGGRCEGGQIQKGTYNVPKAGMYALVFGSYDYEPEA